MKKIKYFVILLLIISCKSEIKKENEKVKILKDMDTVEVLSVKSNLGIQKTYLSELLEKGLIVGDSTEKCDDVKFEFKPKLILVFNFKNNQKLILSEIEYGIKNDELQLFDFSIFDCKKDSILFQSNYTISNYKIVEISPEMILEISSNNIDSVETVLGKIIFYENEGEIRKRNEILYKPIPITEKTKDSIISIFNNNPKLSVLEELLPYLFDACIINDKELKNIFFQIPKTNLLDGGIGEQYSEYKRLLKELGIE